MSEYTVREMPNGTTEIGCICPGCGQPFLATLDESGESQATRCMACSSLIAASIPVERDLLVLAIQHDDIQKS
ncbi:MAG: hypothetical protein PVH19_00055 [Planctomycetia bacterium]|jgi:hypothetical protein